MTDIVTYRWHEPWDMTCKGSNKGDILYNEDHVAFLHNMIRKNMSLPHQIYHYSKGAADKVEDDVISCDFTHDYGGWYMLFSFMVREKPFLFIGIDNVIVRDLANFVKFAKGNGIHSCQSEKPGSSYSGAIWVEDGPEHQKEFELFWNDDQYDKKEWHDELYIEQIMKNKCARFPYEWARSYKRHYLIGEECDAAIIYAFTGRPKPWEVEDEWVKDALK